MFASTLFHGLASAFRPILDNQYLTICWISTRTISKKNKSGEIMSRLTTDTTLLQTVIGSSASMALRSSLTHVRWLGNAVDYQLKAQCPSARKCPSCVNPNSVFGRRVRSLSRKSQDTIADVGSYAGEIIQQIKTVQSFTQEENERAAFKRHVETAFNVATRRIRQRALLIAAVIVLIFGGIVSMIWVGGNDVINGVMTGGELGAFVFYAIVVASAVATISEVIGEVQRAAGATERLFELLEVESLIDSPANPENANTLADHIKIENLTFQYPSRPKVNAIERLSLPILAGQTLA